MSDQTKPLHERIEAAPELKSGFTAGEFMCMHRAARQVHNGAKPELADKMRAIAPPSGITADEWENLSGRIASGRPTGDDIAAEMQRLVRDGPGDAAPTNHEDGATGALLSEISFQVKRGMDKIGTIDNLLEGLVNALAHAGDEIRRLSAGRVGASAVKALKGAQVAAPIGKVVVAGNIDCGGEVYRGALVEFDSSIPGAAFGLIDQRVALVPEAWYKLLLERLPPDCDESISDQIAARPDVPQPAPADPDIRTAIDGVSAVFDARDLLRDIVDAIAPFAAAIASMEAEWNSDRGLGAHLVADDMTMMGPPVKAGDYRRLAALHAKLTAALPQSCTCTPMGENEHGSGLLLNPACPVHGPETEAWQKAAWGCAEAAPAEVAVEPSPIDMILHCPACGRQHIDEPDERASGWSNPPHRSHLCHGCGHIWRPADVPTNGVREIKTRGQNDSPPIGCAAASQPGGDGESDLRDLMRDPRYWRDRDPAIVSRVTEGFRRLLPADNRTEAANPTRRGWLPVTDTAPADGEWVSGGQWADWPGSWQWLECVARRIGDDWLTDDGRALSPSEHPTHYQPMPQPPGGEG